MEYQKILSTVLQVAEIETSKSCSDPLGRAKINLELSKLTIEQIELLEEFSKILRTSTSIVLSEKKNVVNQYAVIFNDPLYAVRTE